jgi:uncharacterized membrane protein
MRAVHATAQFIELKPNCSLTLRAAFLFFGFVCLTCFGIAGFMAAQGFWPVLPFAGLEMLVLGWALAISLRNRRVVQRLAISDNEIRFDSLSAASVEHLVFPSAMGQGYTSRAPFCAAPQPATDRVSQSRL